MPRGQKSKAEEILGKLRASNFPLSELTPSRAANAFDPTQQGSAYQRRNLVV